MLYPYEDPLQTEMLNLNPRKLHNVVERFRNQQRSGSFPGGQLVLRCEGKLVLNEAVGIARGFRTDESIPPVQALPHTPFPVLSAGKPLAAIAIALLEDRGMLDVHAPIAEIFPEFGRHGKDQITTLDVLTHRSGMLMPEFVSSHQLCGDRAILQQALIDAVPVYPRGVLAYQPFEYGWILSEIVLRITGKSLPDFFFDELARPLQLSALQFGLAGRDIDSLAFLYWLGKEKIMVAGVNVASEFEMQNSAQFLNARNPATSLVTDAANLAAFYDFLLAGGRTPEGKQLISERTLQQYTTRNYQGWDRSLKTPLAVGRGFVVGTRLFSSFGWGNTSQCFGLAGGFSCLAFGDYSKNISVAIVTNGNRSLGDFMKRFLPLADGIRRACKK
jgi:CubicO group peptidase (beta-lactamase class C family)